MGQPSFGSFFSWLKKKWRSFGLLNVLFPNEGLRFPNAAQDWEKTFDAMNAAVWIIDNDHFILRANKAAQALFKLPNNRVIGRRCWEIAHGTEGPIPQCPILKSRKTRMRESMPLEIAGRWYEIVVDPIFDGKGNFTKFIHIVTDVTENKRTIEDLKRSRRLLANAQRLSKTGGWEWDVDQQKMYWTKELYRLHGIDPSRFEAGSAEHIDASLQCYRPEDRPVIRTAFEKCADQGVAYDLEFEFTPVDQDRIWIRTAAEPVWGKGRIVKVSGHIIDISEVKRTKDALETQSDRINKLFNAIEDAIFVHPFREKGFGPFAEVNKAACRRYGYTRDEFLTLSAPDITVKSDSNSHAKADHRQRLLEKKQLVFESVHIKKSGAAFPVEINSNIFYQNDKPYILAVVRDITQRKKGEEKREKLIVELQDALEKIKKLQGLLPICSSCKRIRDDKGYWNRLESYIEKHSEVHFSHGMCPECSDRLYGGEEWYEDIKNRKKK